MKKTYWFAVCAALAFPILTITGCGDNDAAPNIPVSQMSPKAFLEGAKKGKSNMQYELGRCYDGGYGTQVDYKKAAKWYKKAAEQKNPKAQAALALCYDGACGVSYDKEKAGELAAAARADLEKLAEGGDPDAAYLLGLLWSSRSMLGWDMEKSKAWLKRSAEGNHPEGMMLYAVNYLLLPVYGAPEGAYAEMMGKAVEGGSLDAKCYMGMAYLFGSCGVKKDEAKGAQMMKEAMDQGCACAQAEWGMCLMDGSGGCKKDPAEGVRLLNLSIEQGNSMAKYRLGTCYLTGIGVEQDVRKGESLLLSAAEIEYTPAKLDLAIMYLHGNPRGIKYQPKKALKYLQELQDVDPSGTAAFFLGECYTGGHAVKQDERKAYEYYEKAAAAGYPAAKRQLALVYMQGNLGYPQDMQKALDLFKVAAEGGDIIAQYFYGMCYLGGIQVPKDREKGIYWLKKSAAQGFREAEAALSKLGQ